MATELVGSISLIPADPGQHGAWIFDTTARALAELPGWSLTRGKEHAKAVIERIPHLRAMVAVPKGYDDELAGWAMGDGHGLLAVYVRYSLRRRGIGTALVGSVVNAGPKVVPVGLWSRAASRMEARGYPWRHDLDAMVRMMGISDTIARANRCP